MTVQVSYSQDSVRIILATIRAILNNAADDEVIHANPADKLGKKVRLVMSKTTRQEEIKAMNREQLAHFLDIAIGECPKYYPLFLLMGRTGLRIGEALALQWDDLDLRNRTVRIARTLGEKSDTADTESTPKGGRGRDVDLSQQLTRMLFDLEGTRREEQARCNLVNLPPWSSGRTRVRPWTPRGSARRSRTPSRLPGCRSTSPRTSCGIPLPRSYYRME